MSEDSMLKCVIAFVLGFFVARIMRGNGLSVGGQITTPSCSNDPQYFQKTLSDGSRVFMKSPIPIYRNELGGTACGQYGSIGVSRL